MESPHKAIEYIITNSGKYAEAKANRVYIEQFLKSKRSMLMSEAVGKSVSAAEVDALAHPEYIKLLDGLKEAIEVEEKLKWMLVAAQAKVEVWRSLEASARIMERATQ
jgi:hypothetical protein